MTARATSAHSSNQGRSAAPPGHLESYTIDDMRFSIIGLTIAAAILMHGPALACDCSQPDTSKAFAEASHVVVVTVVGQDYELPPPPKLTSTDGGLASDQVNLPTAMRYRLAVERAWKGARVGDILVIRRAYAEMSNCDYWLTLGTKHLLYLSYVTRGGQTSLDADAPHCGRSRALDDATSEITAIDALVSSAARRVPPVTSPPTAAPRQRFGCTAAPGRGSWSMLLEVLGALAWLFVRGAKASSQRPSARQSQHRQERGSFDW